MTKIHILTGWNGRGCSALHPYALSSTLNISNTSAIYH